MKLVSSPNLKILKFVLLMVLPFILILVYAVNVGREAADKRTAELGRYMVKVITVEEERIIDETRNFLTGWNQSSQGSIEEACNYPHLSRIKDMPIYAYYGVADASGNLVCGTFLDPYATPAPPPQNVADRKYFKDAFFGKAFSIGEYQIGKVSGTPSMNFGYPLLDKDNNVTGVLFLAQSLDWLDKWVEDVHLPDETVITITDRNGVIVAQYPKGLEEVGEQVTDPQLFSIILSKRTGTTKFKKEGDIERIYAFRPLYVNEENNANVFIKVGLSKSILAEDPTRIMKNILFLFTGAVLFDAVIGLYYMRRKFHS